jgi:hypothetical protein
MAGVIVPAERHMGIADDLTFSKSMALEAILNASKNPA